MVECWVCRTVSGEERGFRIMGTVGVFPDGFPVTPGHMLIVPLRHCPDWFALSEVERRDVDAAVRLVAEEMRESLWGGVDEVAGFNIGWNCGEVAGQTVFHAHCHVIPRRAGDVADPRGGVRGVIPQRQRYVGLPRP